MSNPGSFRESLRLERQGSGQDELGQPIEGWAEVLAFRGRRMRPKAKSEAESGDRDTEVQRVALQVRTHPFLDVYQSGDRLIDLTGVSDVPWNVTGWSEVDGTIGQILLIECERTARTDDGEG